MNLPNKITIVRILLIPLFMVLFYLLPEESLWPVAIFILASITDFIDGRMARSRGLVTTFGKFIDPLADKLLTQAAFILLVDRGEVAGWIALVILARELMITAFRTLAAADGITIAASKWGKYKTFIQMVTIIIFLSKPFLIQQFSWTFLGKISTILLYLALALTILSGLDYLVKNKQVLDLENA